MVITLSSAYYVHMMTIFCGVKHTWNEEVSSHGMFKTFWVAFWHVKYPISCIRLKHPHFPFLFQLCLSLLVSPWFSWQSYEFIFRIDICFRIIELFYKKVLMLHNKIKWAFAFLLMHFYKNCGAEKIIKASNLEEFSKKICFSGLNGFLLFPLFSKQQKLKRKLFIDLNEYEWTVSRHRRCLERRMKRLNCASTLPFSIFLFFCVAVIAVNAILLASTTFTFGK